MTAQQLKNSILQMAVQGKLIPQDPNDEPASALVERIRAEKEQLIKEKKIKKEKNPSVIFRGADNLPYEKVGKNEPVCIADDVPFNIPDSWEWVHLSDIATSGLGKTLNKSIDVGIDTPYLCSINVYWTGIDLSTVKTAKFTQIDRDKYLLQKGDLLICEGGDVGRSAVWNNDREMYYQNALHRVRFLGEINPYFFLYLLECYKGLKIIEKYSKGVTIKHFVQSSLNAMFLPLPPLNEQQRIVNKINEVMPVLTKYDTTYSKVEELNESFPEALKKSILQWAVQGKLVPQDPTDEPAETLLERISAEKQKLIKEEKIKKDKHESIIFRRDNSHYEKLDNVERCIDDELPFNIPESWCWCRLKSIVNVVSARRVHQSDWRSEGVPFYRSREIGKLADTGFVDNELHITEALYNKLSSSGVPHGGDLMVTAVGTLGKTYIVKDDDRFYYKDASVICFENFSKVDPAYLKILMCSPYMEDQIKQNSAGTTVSTITIVKANEYLIPLPPLKEQKRIADQIDYLQQHINKL